MLNNEFYSAGFTPRDEQQLTLLQDFKRLRAVFGTPHPFAYLRSLARTRKYTHTVYPPGWNYK